MNNQDLMERKVGVIKKTVLVKNMKLLEIYLQMPLTKTEIHRRYREKNREKYNQAQMRVYWAKKRFKRRLKIFGDRRCKSREIRLAGNFGANKTRLYCGSCSNLNKKGIYTQLHKNTIAK